MDSEHVRAQIAGEAVGGGQLYRRDDGVVACLFFSSGAVVLRGCSLTDTAGTDLFETGGRGRQLTGALVVDLTETAKGYCLDFAGGLRLRGTKLNWSPNGRPALKLVTTQPAKAALSCGCVTGEGDVLISRCADHPHDPDQPVPYKEVDGGRVTVQAGECEACGELCQPVGPWVFAACSCC